MSELYQSGGDAPLSQDAVGDAGERADTDYDGDTHGDVGAEAIRAREDELPSREDSRASTWGDSPEYIDEADLDDEYYAEFDAFLADEDRLPSRAESRSQTWGDNPEYLDESDLDVGEDQDPPESPKADTADETGDDPADQGDDSAEEPVPPDKVPESATAATERLPREVSDRLTGLETTNSELRQENVELRQDVADLKAAVARLERVNQPEPSSRIANEEDGKAQKDGSKTEARHMSGWHMPTDQALAVGAAASETIAAISDYVPHVNPGAVGITASVVAVGAAAVTWFRARKEAKHAHRPKD